MDNLWAIGLSTFIYLNLLVLLAVLVLYVLQAVGLYGMANQAGVTPRWVAFIPVVNAYIWGKIIKEIRISDYVIPRAEIVLPVAPFVYALFHNINIINTLVFLCLLVLYAVGYYRLYSLYRPDNMAVYTVLSVVFPFVVPFFFYSFRDESPLDFSPEDEKEADADAK